MPQITYNPSFTEKWVHYLSPPEWRNRVRVVFREVPLVNVEHAGCEMDPDVVQGWLETLSAGRSIPPPVVVATERNTFYTHDGNHRLAALQHFLGADGFIKVAEVIPLDGFAFQRVQIDGYHTYALRRTGWTQRVARYVVPPTVACISVVLTNRLHDPGAAPPLALFIISVVLAAFYWGMRGAVLLTVITLTLAAYTTEPANSIVVANVSHLLEILLSGVGVLWISHLISKGHWREQ